MPAIIHLRFISQMLLLCFTCFIWPELGSRVNILRLYLIKHNNLCIIITLCLQKEFRKIFSFFLKVPVLPHPNLYTLFPSRRWISRGHRFRHQRPRLSPLMSKSMPDGRPVPTVSQPIVPLLPYPPTVPHGQPSMRTYQPSRFRSLSHRRARRQCPCGDGRSPVPESENRKTVAFFLPSRPAR